MLSRIWKAAKGVFGKKEVTDRAKIIEDVLFGVGSSHDTEAVKAVAELTTALCSNNCAGVVDAGIFVFFKVKLEDGDYQIFHKRLTVPERAILNDKPSLLKDPYSLLDNLEGAIALEKERAEELRRIALAEEPRK